MMFVQLIISNYIAQQIKIKSGYCCVIELNAIFCFLHVESRWSCLVHVENACVFNMKLVELNLKHSSTTSSTFSPAESRWCPPSQLLLHESYLSINGTCVTQVSGVFSKSCHSAPW